MAAHAVPKQVAVCSSGVATSADGGGCLLPLSVAVDLGLLGSGLKRMAAARGPAGALIGCGSGDVTTTVA